MSHQHRDAKARRREEKIQGVSCRYFVERSLMLRRKYDPRNYKERHEAESYRCLNTELLALAGRSRHSTILHEPLAIASGSVLTTLVRDE